MADSAHASTVAEAPPAPDIVATPGVLFGSKNMGRMLAAFTYRDFRVQWFGACTSSIGTWTQSAAQNWMVLALTGSGFFLGLDLTGDRDGVVGYKAKRNSRLLDLSKIGAHEPADYWEEVITEAGDRLILEPGAFYLLLSAESVRIPPGFAGEMVAYDPTSGELRTHYAGFFDPGFGYDGRGLAGSQAALEVRAHDVPFMVQHRQRVCRLAFERLVEPADTLYGEGIGCRARTTRIRRSVSSASVAWTAWCSTSRRAASGRTSSCSTRSARRWPPRCRACASCS